MVDKIGPEGASVSNVVIVLPDYESRIRLNLSPGRPGYAWRLRRGESPWRSPAAPLGALRGEIGSCVHHGDEDS